MCLPNNPPGQSPKLQTVLLDIVSGKKGSMSDWVDAFIYVWDQPRKRLERLLALLDENIFLKIPSSPPSRGKAEARSEFLRIFHNMPDLRADIHHWSVRGNILFIELTFHTTIGGQDVSWNNVDRFIFRDGVAIEREAFFDPTVVGKALSRAKIAPLKKLPLKKRGH